MTVAALLGGHDAEVHAGAPLDTGHGSEAGMCWICRRWCRRTRYTPWRHVEARDRLYSPAGIWNDTPDVAAPERGGKEDT